MDTFKVTIHLSSVGKAHDWEYAKEADNLSRVLTEALTLEYGLPVFKGLEIERGGVT